MTILRAVITEDVGTITSLLGTTGKDNGLDYVPTSDTAAVVFIAVHVLKSLNL